MRPDPAGKDPFEERIAKQQLRPAPAALQEPKLVLATRTLVEGSRGAGAGPVVCSGNQQERPRAIPRHGIGRDDAAIEEIQMAAMRLKAERPLFAALSNQKLIDAGVAMPTWQDALARYVAG